MTGKIRILVVEDESIEAMDIKRTLKLFDYEVPYIASRGEEAIEKALEIKPDLILMDMVLKGKINGIEVANRLKKLDIPIIYLTAHSDEITTSRALLTEPYGYLLKPFDITELKFTIDLAIYKKKMEKRLIKSEKSYRELAENITGIVYRVLIRKNMQMQFFNEMLKDLTGFTPKELVKGDVCSIDPLIMPEDRENVLKIVQSSIKSKENFLVDYRIKHKDGSIKYFREMGKPVYGDDGQPLYIDGVIFDVTTEKESELKIKYANKKWEDTFNAIEDSICLLDSEGTLLQCNVQMETLLERPNKEFIGKKCWEVLHGTDEPIDNCPVVKMWETKKRETLKLQIDDKWFKITANPILDKSGTIKNVVHILTNITERKRLENEKEKLLKDSQRAKDELLILIENIVDEAWFCNKQGDIILANAAARKFEQDAKPKDEKSLNGLIRSLEVFDSDGRPRPREGSPLLRSLNGEIITDLEEIVIFAGSDEKHYRQISSAPIKNKTGEITGAVAVVRDITRQKKDEIEIFQAKEDWEHTFDAVPDLIAIIDKNYQIIRANKAMANKLGVHPDDAVGLTCYRAVHGMNSPINSCPHKKLLKDGCEHSVEIHEDKLKGDYLVSVSPLYDSPGKLMRSVHVARDVTQRKKAEEKLLDQYNTLEGIINSNESPIFSVDRQYRYTSFNKSHAAVMKAIYDADIEIGKSIFGYQTVQEDKDKAKANIDRALKGELIREEAYSGEEGLSRLYFDVLHNPIRDEECNVIGAAIYAQDVTERKNAEKTLQRSEEKFRALIYNAADIIRILDKNGNIIFDSPSSARILGYREGSIIGKSPLEFIHPDDLERVKHDLDEVYENRNPGIPTEFRIRKADGEYLPVESISQNMIDVLGIEGIVVTTHPIKERKEMEDNLKASLKEKELLLKEIHHRVKNNMQIISSLLNLQKNYVEEEESLNILKESQNRVKSMAMIHEKLYKSETLTHINIKDYIQSLVTDLFYSYSVKESRINAITEIDDIKLNLETAIPCGLLINEIVSNSLKYAFKDKEQGEIKMSLKKHDQNLELIISDNGIGLPEDVDFKKTGSLGLQIVNSLIAQLDGKIELERTQGTKFTIIFKELEYERRI